MVTESKKLVKAVYSANESVTVVRNNGAVTSSVQYSHFQDTLKPVLRDGARVLSLIICHPDGYDLQHSRDILKSSSFVWFQV
jgi:hypothetical protein